MKTTAFWDATPCGLVDVYWLSEEFAVSMFIVKDGTLPPCLFLR
jgi:hypothetical protein